METLIFMGSVFLAGILSFFSPCIFPLLPVYIGILMDKEKQRNIRIFRWQINWYGLIKTLMFIAGLSVIFLILGFGAGILGKILYANWFKYVLGTVVILLGLHQAEVITFKKLQQQKSITFQNRKDRNDLLSAFLLGVTFSLGWTPCVGPVLSSVLAVAAGGTNAAQAVFLMMVYALGLSVPFLLIALTSSVILEHFNKLKPYIPIFKKVGGYLIIFMGILLITGQLNALANMIH